MKHVVITGSTRGIGFGLAIEFLRAGCKVTINGRSQESVDQAINRLIDNCSGTVQGFVADVEKRQELEKLWTDAERQFGKVDIWINNAGIDQGRDYFWELQDE